LEIPYRIELLIERGESAAWFARSGGSFGAEAYAGTFEEAVDEVFATNDDPV